MGKVVYLKDRRPEAPGQILANLEKARQDMEDVERQLDEHLQKLRSRNTNITLRQALSVIGLMLLVIGFIFWRIKYGA